MKLKLLALAVGGLMAGAVSAQSANVTLYGVVDTFIANERAGASPGRASASANVVEPGGLSGSRWGLRGSESLGGGLNAVFVAEGGILSDTGGSAQGGLLVGRQVFVGLNGGFGSFTMGRQYSPLFSVLCEVDIDGCSTFSVVGNHYIGLPGALRINNSLLYTSPNMGGLTVSAMWGAGESAAGTSAGRTLSLNAQYKAGPLYAGLAYADVKNAAGTASAGRTAIAALGFDAGVAKLTASYLENKNTLRGTDVLAPTLANTATGKFKGFQVGAAVPFGATTLILNAGQGKVGPAKQTLFNIGADHSLSKRTTVYARYASADNNGAHIIGAITPGTPATATAPATADAPVYLGAFTGKPGVTGRSSDKRIIALGIRHRF
jgi:predicted porin